MNSVKRIFTVGSTIVEYVGFFVFMSAMVICIFFAFCIITLADIFERALKFLRIRHSADECPRCKKNAFEWKRASFKDEFQRWRGECYWCKYTEFQKEYVGEDDDEFGEKNGTSRKH